MTNQMKTFKLGQKFEQYTDCFVNGKPRYQLIVRDSSNPVTLANGTMACFVVPLGAERELKIFTEEQQVSILDQAQVARLIFVILNKNHKYENLD